MGAAYDELRRLFEAVVDLPARERDDRLAALQRAAPTLVAEVRAMLDADARSTLLDRGLTSGLGVLVARELAREEAVPEQVGRYRIVGRLGAGGMGIVYEAEQDRPSRRVALKTLLPWLRPGAPLRWIDGEAEAMARLVHPAIPQVFEVFEAEGRTWLAMERVHGAPLDAWAAGRPPTAIFAVLAEVARALAYAHAAGVVHGDLKPSNVLVTADGKPKVLDFGLARMLGDGDAAFPHAGTPAFWPPERRAGAAADASADLWALGVSLHVLLAGHLPGEGAPPIDPTARRILARALAPAPAERYPSALAFAADLAGASAGHPVGARGLDLRYRLARALARHRRGAAFVAAAVLLLGAVAGERWRSEAELAATRRAGIAARWERTWPRVLAALDAGHLSAADAEVRAFGQREGDDAAALALVDLAAALEARGQPRPALRAWALAHALEEPPGPARLGLARYLFSHRRFGAVEALLADVQGPEELALAREAARALRRDPADLPPAAQAISRGVATSWPVSTDFVPGDPALAPVVVSAEAILELSAPPALAVVARYLNPWGHVPMTRVDLGGLALVVCAADGLRLVRPAGAAWAELGRWDLGCPTAVSVQDGVLWASLPPTRGRDLVVLTPGDPEVRRPAPTITRLGSDIHAIARDDLDGDGAAELYLGVGHWFGFGVRRLVADGDRWRETRPVELGHVGALAPVDDVHGRWLAALSQPPMIDMTRTIGPTYAGLAALALVDGELAQVAGVDDPDPAPWGGGLHVADIDGDGAEEVIAVREADSLLVWRRGAAALEAFPLPGLRVVRTFVVGGRAAFLVQRSDRPELWVTGLGGEPLPGPPPRPRPAPPTPRDPAIAGRWLVGRQLAAWSLADEGAEVLTGLAADAVYPVDRRALARELAALRSAQGTPQRALEAFALAEAVADADLDADRDAARRSALAPEGAASPIDLTGGLVGWTFADPSLLRSDRGGLTVDLFSDTHDYAALPLVPQGEVVELHLTLDVLHARPGSPIEIGVRAGSRRLAVRHGVYGSGPGAIHRLALAGENLTISERDLDAQGRIEAILRVAPRRAHASLRWRVGDGPWSELPIHTESPWEGAPLALTIESHPPFWPHLSHSRDALRSLTITGARPAPSVAWRPENALVADRADEVERATLPAWTHPWVLAEQQQHRAAADGFAAGLAAGEPAIERLALHLAHAAPSVYVPLLQAALPRERWLDLLDRLGEPYEILSPHLNDPALADIPLTSDARRRVVLWRARSLAEAGELAMARAEHARLAADPGKLAGAIAELGVVVSTPSQRSAALDRLRDEAPAPDYVDRLVRAGGEDAPRAR